MLPSLPLKKWKWYAIILKPFKVLTKIVEQTKKSEQINIECNKFPIPTFEVWNI